MPKGDAQQRAQSARMAASRTISRPVVWSPSNPKRSEFKQIADDQRALIEARANFVRRPVLMKGKLPIPRPAANTASVHKGGSHSTSPGPRISGQGSESANKDTGVYDLAVQSIGAHNKSVGAGIGFWFSSDAAGNPTSASLLAFLFLTSGRSTQWGILRIVPRAHGHGGLSERGWVATSADQKPSWSQGVGWGQSQAISEGGPSNFETFFNPRPNSLYACWVQSSARVDADSGAFGFADLTIHLNVELMFAQFT